MPIALEPMVLEKSFRTRVLADGWTVVSADGGLTAHYEHSVAVTPEGPYILTALHDEDARLKPEGLKADGLKANTGQSPE
jgi:methionyl aminopeptidase